MGNSSNLFKVFASYNKVTTMYCKTKGLLLILIILISSCNSSDETVVLQQQIDCLPSSLQNGVIAYYTFSNGSINDVSGNGNHLTNNTSASSGTDRDGNLNCAFEFNLENSEYLEYQNPTFLDDLHLNDFSISFWLNISSNSGLGNFISRDNTLNCTWTEGQWSVVYVNDVIQFGVNGAVAIEDEMVSLNNWEHFTVTASGTNLKFYRNGILSVEEIDGYLCELANPTINEGDLFIGKIGGLMDDIIIYNRLLTDSEVNELYNLPPCCN